MCMCSRCTHHMRESAPTTYKADTQLRVALWCQVWTIKHCLLTVVPGLEEKLQATFNYESKHTAQSGSVVPSLEDTKIVCLL